MPSIDPVSDSTKKKLNLLKVALTDEFDGEPTFDEVIEWMFSSGEPPEEKIKEEVQPMISEEVL